MTPPPMTTAHSPYFGVSRTGRGWNVATGSGQGGGWPSITPFRSPLVEYQQNVGRLWPKLHRMPHFRPPSRMGVGVGDSSQRHSLAPPPASSRSAASATQGSGLLSSFSLQQQNMVKSTPTMFARSHNFASRPRFCIWWKAFLLLVARTISPGHVLLSRKPCFICWYFCVLLH